MCSEGFFQALANWGSTKKLIFEMLMWKIFKAMSTDEERDVIRG